MTVTAKANSAKTQGFGWTPFFWDRKCLCFSLTQKKYHFYSKNVPKCKTRIWWICVDGFETHMKRCGGVVITLPETNSYPMKIGHPKRKLRFQASIFRCNVIFREGTQNTYMVQPCLDLGGDMADSPENNYQYSDSKKNGSALKTYI